MLNNAKGSSTLEASIIFPVVMLMLLAFGYFSVYLYEKLVLVDAAVYYARQAAVNWNNSDKDLETGSLAGSSQNDGLYWRITRDFDESTLAKGKTERATQLIRERLRDGFLNQDQLPEISVTYDNDLVRRTVSVAIKEKVSLPIKWLKALLPTKIFFGAKAEVTEPVEFVRNVDLTAEYLAEVKSYLRLFDQEVKDGENGRVVLASTESSVNGNKVYHYAGCKYLRQIKSKNLVEFGSEGEANAMGFHICVECAKSRLYQESSGR